MPWKECSAVSQRVEFVRLAQAAAANVAELCRRFGISRKTGYKWLQRFAGATRRARRAPSRPGTPLLARAPQLLRSVFAAGQPVGSVR